MQELRRLEQDILEKGKVDSDHLESLRLALRVGGKVGRAQADFLVDLHKRVQHPNPAFEALFYRAIKDHVLADGRIDAEEAGWLRRVLFADGKIDDEGRQLMRELKGDAERASPEFDALFDECMKMPPEQRTCG